MADSKISNLTTTSTIGTADLITTVQSGTNKTVTGTVLRDQIGWTRSGTDVVLNTSTDHVGVGVTSLAQVIISTRP